jgi:AcrR family transcriptional regulator
VSTTTRRPGRPRSAEAHQAILQAALDLAVEGGLAGMSMEGIAARSGVGKATIYRRWPTKHAVVADALRTILATVEAPDTGSVRDDFVALAEQAMSNAPGALRLMPRLLTEASEDPELLAVCQEVLVEPRRAATREILRRAVERGQLRSDLDLELAIDALAGPVIYASSSAAATPPPSRACPSASSTWRLPGWRPSSPAARRGAADPASFPRRLDLALPDRRPCLELVDDLAGPREGLGPVRGADGHDD